MTPQERNILIAEAMGIEIIRHAELGLIMSKNGGQFIYPIKIWNPSENAEQEKMIKAKLREWGCTYEGLYETINRKNLFWFTIFYYKKSLFKKREQKYISKSSYSESTAFLDAVGELCLTLKNQK